jgi:hypothetical protein
VARLEGVADNGIFIDSRQASGLPDATTVLQVLEDVESLAVFKPAAKQSRAFAFGKTLLASAAGQHAALLARTVAEADAEIALGPQAVIRAVRVLTTEQIKVFHEQHRSKFSGWVDNASLVL